MACAVFLLACGDSTAERSTPGGDDSADASLRPVADASPGALPDAAPGPALDAAPGPARDAAPGPVPDAAQVIGADAAEVIGTDAVAPTADAAEVVGTDAVTPAADAVAPAADAAVPPPPVDDPHAAGPHGVSAGQVSVDMPGGGLFPRRIDVFVHRPDDPADGPFPLLVFSHGFQLAGSDYTSYAERWASHGFVVVAPTYDGLLSRNHAELAEDFVTILDWALAQNADPEADLFGSLDPERIGAAGHSRGGKQSFFGALLDPRVDAVFGLDPVDSGPPFGGNDATYPSLAPERVGELEIPTAVVGSERGPEGAVACAPGDDNWDDYYAALNSPSFAWRLAGSGHMDFMDACNLACLACAGGDDPEFVREFSRATSTAFFRHFLRGEAGYRPWLDGDAARADARVEVQSK